MLPPEIRPFRRLGMQSGNVSGKAQDPRTEVHGQLRTEQRRASPGAAARPPSRHPGWRRSNVRTAASTGTQRTPDEALVQLIFTGCSSEGARCDTPGEPEGTVMTEPLESYGYEEGAGYITVLGGGPIMSFGCGHGVLTLSGTAAGQLSVPLNTPTSSGKGRLRERPWGTGPAGRRRIWHGLRGYAHDRSPDRRHADDRAEGSALAEEEQRRDRSGSPGPGKAPVEGGPIVLTG